GRARAADSTVSPQPGAAAQPAADASKSSDAETEDEEEDEKPSAPKVPLEEFLASSPHPLLVSISADYMVYASDRKWLYARGNVRCSGRGFVVAAETLRLDVGL